MALSQPFFIAFTSAAPHFVHIYILILAATKILGLRQNPPEPFYTGQLFYAALENSKNPLNPRGRVGSSYTTLKPRYDIYNI